MDRLRSLAETISERCKLNPREAQDLLLNLEGAEEPHVALLEAISKELGNRVTPLLRHVATLDPEDGLDDVKYDRISVMSWISDVCPYILPLAIEAGAEINQVLAWYCLTPLGLTPLGSAVSRGFVDLAARLLEMGADPNLAGGIMYPLDYAVDRKDRTMVELLLGAGANPNAFEGRSPPLLRALRFDIDFARILLMHGADWKLCPSREVVALPLEEFRWFVECSGYTRHAVMDEGESLVEQLDGAPDDPKMVLALSV